MQCSGTFDGGRASWGYTDGIRERRLEKVNTYRQEAMAAMPTQFRGESDGNLGLQCIHTVVNQRHSCQNDNGADLKKKCCTIW